MICINCQEPVKSLFISYSQNHIKLTDCPNCNKVVDKYIEYDELILFINLILLKPGAYRHMVHNTFESKENTHPQQMTQQTKEKPWILSRINRIRLVMLTFEVYLTWAYEENMLKIVKYYRSPVMEKIFDKSAIMQYFYFTGYCVLDQLLLIHLTTYFFSSLIPKKYKHNTNYIISYTILLAHGARLFPVLMLIWPYDSLISAGIIKWVSTFYIIEGLRIITNCSYTKVLICFGIISSIKLVVLNSTLSYFLIGHIDYPQTFKDILQQLLLI